MVKNKLMTAGVSLALVLSLGAAGTFALASEDTGADGDRGTIVQSSGDNGIVADEDDPEIEPGAEDNDDDVVDTEDGNDIEGDLLGTQLYTSNDGGEENDGQQVDDGEEGDGTDEDDSDDETTLGDTDSDAVTSDVDAQGTTTNTPDPYASRVYTFTFDANGGTFPNDGSTTREDTRDLSMYEAGTTTNPIQRNPSTDPTRDGYYLTGWKDVDTGAVYDLYGRDAEGNYAAYLTSATFEAQWAQHDGEFDPNKPIEVDPSEFDGPYSDPIYTDLWINIGLNDSEGNHIGVNYNDDTTVIATPIDGTPGEATEFVWSKDNPHFISDLDNGHWTNFLYEAMGSATSNGDGTYTFMPGTYIFSFVEENAGKVTEDGVLHDSTTHVIQFELYWDEEGWELYGTNHAYVRMKEADGSWFGQKGVNFTDTYVGPEYYVPEESEQPAEPAQPEDPVQPEQPEEPAVEETQEVVQPAQEPAVNEGVQETVIPVQTTAAPVTQPQASLPKTADTTNAALPAGVVAAGAGLIGAAVALGRKAKTSRRDA